MYRDAFLDNIILQSILDTRRSNKEKLFPIKFRITQKSKQVLYSSGIYCSVKDWNLITTPKTELKKSDKPETKKLDKSALIVKKRNEIQFGHDAIKANIKSIIENNNGVFSFDKFNNLIKKNTSDTLNAAFIAKINETKSEGKIGTSIYYNCALKSIEKFAGNNILFSDITVKWLNNYEKYMIDNDATYTTVGMYCRALRTIINVAKRNNIIKESDYPFQKNTNEKGKYQIPTGEGRNKALTLQQIGELMKAEVSETENKYRDLWFFSYLCNGINIGDLCRLKHSDIENDIISFYRQKTINTSKHKVKIEAVLLPQMKEIIKRWNENKNQTDYVFPFLTGKEDPTQTKKQVQNITRLINKHIKRIAERINIDNISTYTARHSFATVLKRSGANIAYISESLGHTDIKTTTSYLDSFEKAEQQKNANLLIPKI